MMKTVLKPMIWQRSLLLLLAGVLLTGCFEENIITYDGPAILEMAPYTPNGQYSRTLAVPHNYNGEASYNVRVQLVAPHQPQAVSFALSREGDAEQGTHYTLSPESGYQVAANSSWADVSVTMQAANFAPGESRSVTFTISSADVEINENYNSFTVVMAKQTEPDDD